MRYKQAGRGGTGTVFRDKKIKAIVVKYSGPVSPEANHPADLELVKRGGREFSKEIVTEFLAKQLRKILNLDQVWDLVVVGAGDVGHALARYQGFLDRGFQVKYIFDNDPSKIGKKIGDFTVLGLDEMKGYIQKNGIKVAMLTVPASVAQNVSDQLVEAGIYAA